MSGRKSTHDGGEEKKGWLELWLTNGFSSDDDDEPSGGTWGKKVTWLENWPVNSFSDDEDEPNNGTFSVPFLHKNHSYGPYVADPYCSTKHTPMVWDEASDEKKACGGEETGRGGEETSLSFNFSPVFFPWRMSGETWEAAVKEGNAEAERVLRAIEITLDTPTTQ